MNPSNRPALRAARVLACLALLNFAVPGGAIVAFGVPLREATQKALAARAAAARDLAKRRAKSASRLLTAKEEASLQGRTGENPYLAGQAKWDVVYKGVDLMTGNYSTSATDLSFDGGYGIPVNVTRSYSANQADEGPFGKGWTLSADVRSTAGGLLKSGGAPVRSVPTSLKERAEGEADPNVAVAPAQAVTATDAGGTEETVQRDVDGILTTPPWDKNTYDAVYEWKTLPNGTAFQVLVSNTVRTAEGTVYAYAKEGSYPDGTVPWNAPGTAPTAANVLKPTSATDRQGNVTTYSYGSTPVAFQKSNGVTSENPLVGVSMPGGHHLTFVWGTDPNAASSQRVTAVSDDSRTVTYTYAGDPGHGLLASATTPGGKTTLYGYGSSVAVADGINPGIATGLLTSVTDPRGLTTGVRYYVENRLANYSFPIDQSIHAYCIAEPNGHLTFAGEYSVMNWQNYRNQAIHTPHPDDPSLLIMSNATFYEGGWVVREYAGSSLVRRFSSGYGIVAPSGTVQVVISESTSAVNQPDYQYYPATKIRIYDAATQDLVVEQHRIFRNVTALNWHDKGLDYFANGPWTQTATTTKSYNFMGQPLSSRVQTQEFRNNGSGPNLYSVRSASVDYAYWGADKYFQQKAVRDPAGRYAYTDYYPSTAPAGKRGQTSRVYDPKNAGFTVDSSLPAPPRASGQSQGDYDAKLWKYQLRPASADAYSARFDYDGQGRPTDVWKLQSTATSPWTYVQTHTAYGGDGAPGWGQASQVVEDSGGIDRTTQTLASTAWGKACDVVDAAGHEFVTDFDPDGRVNSVTRTDGGANQAVVTYAYGTSGVSNGQPISVTDGLSGVSQTLAYCPSGGGVGMPSSVSEQNGSDAYSVSYGYSAEGDRAIATYQTPQGTTRWGYSDYTQVGGMEGGRAFTRLMRLDASGKPTPEEFDYQYDTAGRLREATFAMSPALVNGQPYVPPASQGYYDASHPAASRARAHYDYDPEGRVREVSTNWDVYGGNGYNAPTVIADNTCGYELSGLNRGLKTQSAFAMLNAAGDGYDSHTESYGYDASLDYLTSASYGDGLPNASKSWTYDAAGNRADAVCDALNRPTSLGGAAVTSDVLGNRLTKGGTTYAWDCLSRMTGQYGGGGLHDGAYQYRADGMRTLKVIDPAGQTYNGALYTRFRYDGQMGFEDWETQGGYATLYRYGLGARGIDVIDRQAIYPEGPQANVRVFPVYDAHGNGVATLSRDGNGGFSLNDRRSFDAWGVVRSEQHGNDPRLRYCASLGHKQDDESGLVYMRARYYEPTSGRFVSEDPSMSGVNLFVYAADRPTSYSDRTGKAVEIIDAVFQNAYRSFFLNPSQETIDKLARYLKWMQDTARTEKMMEDADMDKGKALLGEGGDDDDSADFKLEASFDEMSAGGLEAGNRVKAILFGEQIQIMIEALEDTID